MAVTISCEIGQTLDRIGEGLFIDLRVFGANAVTNSTIGYGGKL